MRKRAKRSNNKNAELEHLSLALTLNGRAMEDGPKRKHWSAHDIKHITPLTATQEDMFHSWFNGYNICAHGSAGTGKTFLALYLAMHSLLDRREQNRIIIVRSAVATRDVGFLPGTLEEKTALYELPYHDIMWELIGRASTYQDMKDANIIEFMTTSFIRGLTWDNAIVIMDEAQNMTFHELDSVMTRLGENSRIIVTGDIRQTDLDGKKNGASCGMGNFVKVVEGMKEFSTLHFTVNDIVRSSIVKSWIMASEAILQSH